MSAADDDLHLAVSEAIASVVRIEAGPTISVGDMAQAAIDAVRRHDAAKVVPFRRPVPTPVRTPGWDGDTIAARQAPEGPR